MARGKKWTDEQKCLAVAAYVGTGSFQDASDITGIPRRTIQDWHDKRPDWWDRIEAEAWSQAEQKHSAGYKKAIERCLVQIEDRVENGDIVIARDGGKHRVPVKALDLAKIAGICQDKLNILRGKPTSISGKAEATAAEKLEELRQWGRKQQAAAEGNVVPIGGKAG